MHSNIIQKTTKIIKIHPKISENGTKIYKNMVWGGFWGSWGAGSAPGRSARESLTFFDTVLAESGAQRADFGIP